MKKREKKQDDKRSTRNNNNINNRKNRKNMSISAGAQAGISAGTQLLGMIGGHGQERRNYRNNRRLMELQHQNQMGLNRQGHDLQMDMWNKTNYGAQVEHMKNAGLNPALMYKGAGAGGTTGSQGGGSASMGSSQQGKVMDLQNALLGAQIKGIEAKANSDNASADATRGYKADESGAAKDKIRQDIENLKAAKLDIEAATNLKLTQNETEGIKRDIQKLDKNFFEKNNLSPSEFGIIKGIKSALGSVKDAYDFIINATPEEKKAAFGMDNMDERYEALQKKLKAWRNRDQEKFE